MLKNFTTLLFFSIISIATQAQHIDILQQGKSNSSIRGLSVVDDKTAWVSGNRGYVAITTDAGKTWTQQFVKGFERADFRDIEAFSDKEAIIMSSGTPALIFKTTDGGATWQEKYRNTDTTYFLDAMDFDSPKHGIVLGDPIKNKFLLLETNDGAETWHPFKNQPDAIPGEAAFAASGTCLRIINNNLYIVSGGTTANIFSLGKNDKKWQIIPVSIAKGKSSEGAFSMSAVKNNLVVVGGNYSQDKRTDSTACYSINNGKSWQLANTMPAGFQSGVEYITQDIFLATGTSGSNFTSDVGKTWAKIDNTSYNVCRKAKNGKLVLLAGDRGKIGVFVP